MVPRVQPICHGLAPCRACGLPVAAPPGILERELFHLRRCPHCHSSNPHPYAIREIEHTRRTAKIGAWVLIACVAVLLMTPSMELVWSRLQPYS